MSQARVLRAVVLKSHDTGNTSEVVHVLTGELGRISVYARGLKDPRSRHAGVLQPLSEVELSLHLKDGADLGTLRDATLIDAHPAIASDLERLALGLLLAEAASTAGEPGHPCEDAYEALRQGLARIEPASGLPPLDSTCAALADLLHAMGYGPQLDATATRPWPAGEPRPTCFWLRPETATIHLANRQPTAAPDWPITRPRATTDFPIPPSAVRFLHNLAQGDTVPRLTAPEAMQLIEALVRIAELHHDAPLRANRFWREISGQEKQG